MHRIFKPSLFFFMACAALLSACMSEPLTLSKSADDDYQKAQALMEREDYAQVIMFLEKFSAKYPYSQYATDAELFRLQAAYLDEQYVLSEVLAQRFIDAHPRHEKRIYAQYLGAMSLYHQSHNALLDQQFSHKSREAFIALNEAFPKNEYTDEINKYLNIITNRVASYETTVGKFYLDKGLYVSAVHRLLVVKNKYMLSESGDEALFYLASAYAALGQDAYVHEITSLLNANFSTSPWLKKAQALL